MADVPFITQLNFDAEFAQQKIEANLTARIERAANYLLAQVIAREPTRTGAMRASTRVDIKPLGFKVVVQKYYAPFVEFGHLVGKRRSSRATAIRRQAMKLRQLRKATGNKNLKVSENELREQAKQEQAAYAEQRQKGTFVEAHPFANPAIDAARDEIIRILAGQ